MPFSQLTPEQRGRRERALAAMRERFAARRKRWTTRQEITIVTRRVREKVWYPRELAIAIRIAAKMAREECQPNPAFVDALEVAAGYFDEL